MQDIYGNVLYKSLYNALYNSFTVVHCFVVIQRQYFLFDYTGLITLSAARVQLS